MTVDDAAMIATSFPEFRPLMEGLGASFAEARDVRPMIIAIDGPAASGKGTLAKRIAAPLRPAHLDTGLLYRAVARDVRRRGGALDDAGGRRRPRRAASIPPRLDDPGLRGPGVGEAASIVARIPQVRAALLDFQRDFARAPGGAVLDGRDIGTVVCPDADVKIYVTATPGGAGRAPLPGDDRAAASRPPTRRCWPISAAATSAMRAGRHRPCGRPTTPSCWIPAIWI